MLVQKNNRLCYPKQRWRLVEAIDWDLDHRVCRSTATDKTWPKVREGYAENRVFIGLERAGNQLEDQGLSGACRSFEKEATSICKLNRGNNAVVCNTLAIVQPAKLLFEIGVAGRQLLI